MMRIWPWIGALAAIGACSTFTESPNDAGASDDAGSVPSPEGGAVVEAGDHDAPPARGDAGTEDAGCVLFGAIAGGGAPLGWLLDQSAQGNVSAAAVDGRTCMASHVQAQGDHASATRDLSIPASGVMTVSVDVAITTGTTANVGWLVNVVTVACTTPMMQVSLDLVPGAGLAVEATSYPTPVDVGSTASGGFATLTLDFLGSTKVGVTYRGNSDAIFLPVAIQNAKGCTLAVGAVAMGNVPSVTANVAEVCVR